MRLSPCVQLHRLHQHRLLLFHLRENGAVTIGDGRLLCSPPPRSIMPGDGRFQPRCRRPAEGGPEKGVHHELDAHDHCSPGSVACLRLRSDRPDCWADGALLEAGRSGVVHRRDAARLDRDLRAGRGCCRAPEAETVTACGVRALCRAARFDCRRRLRPSVAGHQALRWAAIRRCAGQPSALRWLPSPWARRRSALHGQWP